LAKDSDKERKQAAQWLGERRAGAAVEPLIDCLEDRKIKYEDARKSAATALAQIGDVRAIESLTKTAMDDSWKYSDVRVSAISALSEFDEPQVHETLEKILGNKDPLVRKASEDALTKLKSN
jgi:HEAT repeat protein